MTRSKGVPAIKQRSVTFGAALLVASIVMIDLCDAVFGCGCTSLWGGAAQACNIHHAAPPHCPWCAHPGRSGAVAFLSIAVAQAGAAFAPGGLGIGMRGLLALAAIPLVGGAVAWVQGILFGYWT